MENSSLPHELRHLLKHWHDRAQIVRSPLCVVLARGSRPLTPDELRSLVLKQIERLRPAGAEDLSHAPWRRYQHLILRAHHGYTLERVAEELQVSIRQASRDFNEALADLSVLLSDILTEQTGQEGAASSPSPPIDELAPLLDPAGDVQHTFQASVSSEADLPAALRGTIATLSDLTPSRHAAWIVHCPDTLPQVNATPMLLRQALLHILLAAAETWSGGAISVTASDGEQGLAITITPATTRGQTGISPTAGARLIESAKPILRLLHATLDYSWERNPHILVAFPPVPLHTVLLVDDNPDLALLFRRWTGPQRYRFLTATTGEAALRLVEEMHPDLIILDVLLPGIDGWELLRQLRRLPYGAALRVIVCSVLPERELALSLNVFDFLSKPVTRDSLLELLSRCFATPAVPRGPPIGSASAPQPAALRTD
ncbi:MAG: response regulator [Chloroflexi bacterium]|nr:response regulator [Chloroflexota bacterium]